MTAQLLIECQGLTFHLEHRDLFNDNANVDNVTQIVIFESLRKHLLNAPQYPSITRHSEKTQDSLILPTNTFQTAFG